MGRTVPSFRMALEFEIERWRGFRKALQSEEDQYAFDEIMDMARNNAMAGGAACNPVLFEPLVMSIVLAQQRKIRQIEEKMYEIIWQDICANKNNASVSKKGGS